VKIEIRTKRMNPHIRKPKKLPLLLDLFPDEGLSPTPFCPDIGAHSLQKPEPTIGFPQDWHSFTELSLSKVSGVIFAY